MIIKAYVIFCVIILRHEAKQPLILLPILFFIIALIKASSKTPIVQKKWCWWAADIRSQPGLIVLHIAPVVTTDIY